MKKHIENICMKINTDTLESMHSGKRPMSEMLHDMLREAYKPSSTVEMMVGHLTQYGFRYDLPEHVYYNIYAFHFYQNEWMERIFDTYHVFDNRNGESRIRVNDDGFRVNLDQDLVMLSVIQNLGDTGHDVEVVVKKQIAKKPRPAPVFNLFGPHVVRFSIDEVALKYTDTFSIIFQKTTNLRTMRISYSVKVQISNRNVDNAVRLHHIPNAVTLVRQFLDAIAMSKLGDRTLDNHDFATVSRDTASKLSDCLNDSEKYEVFRLGHVYQSAT